MAKRVTIYDLAKSVGLSVATTSKALNGYQDVSSKTREKVLAVASEMGFEPSAAARSITTKRSWLIGVVYHDEGGGLMNPHFCEILENFRRAVEEAGFQILLVSPHERSLLQTCRYRALDGVMVMSYEEDAPELLELLDAPMPIVLTDFDHPGCASVFSDNREGMEQLVDLLWRKGHREFAYLAAPPHSHTSGIERLDGIKASLRKRGMTLTPEQIVETKEYTFREGYLAAEELFRRGSKATAWVTGYDLIAFGALQYLQEQGGRVPEDVSLTGFDDLPNEEARFRSLTTVRQDRARIGQEAAKLLLAQIRDGQKDSIRIRLPVTLTERGSVREIALSETI